MRPLRRIAVVVLLGWVVALLLRRRGAAGPTAVDVYFQDGSLASFGEGTADGARMLSLAREIRRAAAA
jgi:hypothetical protein